jgi:hypothetical protein
MALKNSIACGDCKAVCPANELTELIEGYFRGETGSHQDNSVTPWGVPKREQRYRRNTCIDMFHISPFLQQSPRQEEG